jgi:hypothetical protein
MIVESKQTKPDFEKVDAMTEQCEFLEKCGFFQNYRGSTETIKAGWVKMFCESKEKSAECERKKVRQQTGQPPADNMCPTGKLLWG